MTRAFGQFAHKERLGDRMLCEAIERAERGIVDADLGGGVIKQRVARPGQGRSGGYRTLIAFRSQTRAVFLFGFAKKDLDNIGDSDLKRLRKTAAEMLSWNDSQVATMLAAGKWTEIGRDA
ncbi:MAG: type II toxin-antitoxin system RelE/ParE family toxin [Rhodomicrobium sp.]